MTPVDQTKFYDPDAPPEKQRGNCLTAVVASLMDLPIDAVPNFVQDHVDHDADENVDWDWWTRLRRFIAQHGYAMHYLRPVADPDCPAESHFRDPGPGEPYAVTGVSPRDPRIFHIVIYRDGEMVHDPHPDRTGLAVVRDQYHWTLHPAAVPRKGVTINGGKVHVRAPGVRPKTRCGRPLRAPNLIVEVPDVDQLPPGDRCAQCFPGSRA